MNTQATQKAIFETVLTADTEALARIHAACERKPQRRRVGTLKDAASILSVHQRTVTRYAMTGKLHPIRLSARKVRWDLDEVERLASEGVTQ